jgi:hypothetical protein
MRCTATLFFDTDNLDVLWFCPACDDNGADQRLGGNVLG